MAYRDDEEAALARADALQRDLDDTRRERDEAERKAAEAEAQLAAAREQLARREHERAEAGERAPAPPPPARSAFRVPDYDDLAGTPHRERPSAATAIAISVVLCVIGGLVCVGAANERRDARRASPPNPTCTLRTAPSGATIVAHCHDSVADQMNAGLADAGLGGVLSADFEMSRGTTPLAKERLEWLAESVTCGGGLVARLAGYEDTPVSEPLAGMGCSERVIPLRPR